MKNLIKASLKVTVNGFDKILKGKASVYVKPTNGRLNGNAKEIKLQYNNHVGNFTSHDLLPGSYTLVAESKGYETQTRQLSLNSGEHEQQFILGTKGTPFY